MSGHMPRFAPHTAPILFRQFERIPKQQPPSLHHVDASSAMPGQFGLVRVGSSRSTDAGCVKSSEVRLSLSWFESERTGSGRFRIRRVGQSSPGSARRGLARFSSVKLGGPSRAGRPSRARDSSTGCSMWRSMVSRGCRRVVQGPSSGIRRWPIQTARRLH